MKTRNTDQVESWAAQKEKIEKKIEIFFLKYLHWRWMTYAGPCYFHQNQGPCSDRPTVPDKTGSRQKNFEQLFFFLKKWIF